MLSSSSRSLSSLLRPLRRGMATKAAVGGAGTAVGAALLAKLAQGALGELELKATSAAPLPPPSGAIKSLSSASSASALLSEAKLAILLEGTPAEFQAAGKALAPGAIVGVMGATNALIVASAAGEGKTVTAISKVAQAAGEAVLAAQGSSISNVIAWGDGVVDVSHATVDGKWALSLTDNALPATTPASPEAAADAIISHMKDLVNGTGGAWTSMGVPAVGDFGTGTGIFYSVPVVCEGGTYKRVGGISLAPEVAEAMEKARVALLAEKEGVKQYL